MPHITAEFANNYDFASRLQVQELSPSTTVSRKPCFLTCASTLANPVFWSSWGDALPAPKPIRAEILGCFQHLSPAMLCTMNSKPCYPQANKHCFNMLQSQGFFLANRALTTRPGLSCSKKCAGGKTKQTSVGEGWPKELFRWTCYQWLVWRMKSRMRCRHNFLHSICPTLCVLETARRSSSRLANGFQLPNCEVARQSTSFSYLVLPHPASPRRRAGECEGAVLQDGRKHT